MSSTGPIPQPGAEALARYVDVVRQRQQEAIRQLTLAQQQAAKPVASTPPPAPGMTVEALLAKLNDQLSTLTTTVQRQERDLREGLAGGYLTTFEAGWNVAQTRGALDVTMHELDAIRVQIDAKMKDLETQRRLDQIKLDQLKDVYAQVRDLASVVVQSFDQLKEDILRNLKD